MKRLLSLSALLLASALQPLAARASNSFSMDCSKPMYVPNDMGPGVRKLLLEKGVPALLDIEGKEDLAAVSEGAVVFSKLNASIEAKEKYFGPARWTEYTCSVRNVTIAQKFGSRLADVYVSDGAASESQLTDGQKVDPCTPAIRKALSGLSCKGRQNFGSSNTDSPFPR